MAFSDMTTAITSLVGNNAQSYLAPMGTIIGTNMNSGFYRNVSPHKILGFDITFDVAYSMNPIGQTTYQFIIPDDSVGFTFPFKFPKNLLVPESSPMYNYIPHEGLNETLYKDREIDFGLAVRDMLDPPDGESQNVFGTGEWDTLLVTLNNAIPEIFNQVIDETWDIAKDIPGIGTEYELTYKQFVPGADSLEFTTTLDPLYSGPIQFEEEFGGPIDSLIRVGLGDMEMPKVPIPPGVLGEMLNNWGIPEKSHGLPLPIIQASVGLPFHTEITIRGLPIEYDIEGVGSIQFGGFGGKIGISDYLSDILYKSENEIRRSKSKDLQYIIDSQPSDIKAKDVSKAMSYLLLQEMDVHEIDSLNYLFGQGDQAVVIEIQNRMRDAQIQLESNPKSKKKKKKKKFPIDLSLGYYANDLKLDFSGAYINSNNRMISLQAGKTLNLPSFLSFLGGFGLYAGLGFESSDLNLGYLLANPLAYGCFSGSGTYKENIEDEEGCTGSNSWETGVPTDISLSFPGDNTFRSLIGARMRILFVDAYVDYNMGNSNNAINAGLGITFR